MKMSQNTPHTNASHPDDAPCASLPDVSNADISDATVSDTDVSNITKSASLRSDTAVAMPPLRVLVYGLGRSGMAACQLLCQQGHEVIAFDAALSAENQAQLQAWGCQLSPPLQTAAEVAAFVSAQQVAKQPLQLCIAAPGIAWQHPALQALRQAGIETIGEVEWVYRSVAADIIGITGTAGKTSVTRWLSDCLCAAGLDAPAGGNINPALAAVARPGATLVAELSSFQLERCPRLKPRIAIVLNLGRDHIDRHGSLEAYHAAKYQLIANLDANSVFIYNHDDLTLRQWAAQSPARCLAYSLAAPDSGLEPVCQAYWHKAPAADDASLWLYLHGQALLSADSLQVRGNHARSNALAVALAADAMGLSHQQLRQGLQAFCGVAGRLESVGCMAAVDFIEDSIATRSLAVKAALEASTAPIVWLAGGQDKGAEFAELELLIRQKVSLFIGVGAAGSAFAAQCQAWTATQVIAEPDGEKALQQACCDAFAHLQSLAPPGQEAAGTVLLAPLAASFDQFQDYQARAKAFRNAVQHLQQGVWQAPQNSANPDAGSDMGSDIGSNSDGNPDIGSDLARGADRG